LDDWIPKFSLGPNANIFKLIDKAERFLKLNPNVDESIFCEQLKSSYLDSKALDKFESRFSSRSNPLDCWNTCRKYLVETFYSISEQQQDETLLWSPFEKHSELTKAQFTECHSRWMKALNRRMEFLLYREASQANIPRDKVDKRNLIMEEYRLKARFIQLCPIDNADTHTRLYEPIQSLFQLAANTLTPESQAEFEKSYNSLWKSFDLYFTWKKVLETKKPKPALLKSTSFKTAIKVSQPDPDILRKPFW
jgi:hypothetical protein